MRRRGAAWALRSRGGHGRGGRCSGSAPYAWMTLTSLKTLPELLAAPLAPWPKRAPVRRLPRGLRDAAPSLAISSTPW